jgi:peptidoglycan hydrolase-like protein with peptidoglycan-binding domain
MLTSVILSGNARLDEAAAGGPSVKKAPPADDPDAVRRIQKALAALEFSMPRSFPEGPEKEPDGKYGDETHQTVVAFQRKEFPTEPGQWDGRCGKNTLARMDEMLLEGSETVTLRASQVATSNCERA